MQPPLRDLAFYQSMASFNCVILPRQQLGPILISLHHHQSVLNPGEGARMILSPTAGRECVLHFRRGKGGPRHACDQRIHRADR
jgi:hypothetical protein